MKGTPGIAEPSRQPGSVGAPADVHSYADLRQRCVRAYKLLAPGLKRVWAGNRAGAVPRAICAGKVPDNRNFRPGTLNSRLRSFIRDVTIEAVVGLQ